MIVLHGVWIHIVRGMCLLFTLTVLGCSLDPIGALYQENPGPYTEQVGPYLRLTFNPGPDWFPSWSGDGSRIVYSAWGFEQKTQGQMTVNVIPASGGTSTRISPVFARTDFNFYPCWLDADNTIAYVSFRGLNFTSPLEPSITIVDVNDIRDFTENLIGMNSPLDISFSADGGMVAYSDYLTTIVYTDDSTIDTDDSSVLNWRTRTSSSLTAIWIATVPLTGVAVRLEGTEGADDLSWSPDSQTLAFSKNGDVYTVPRTGGSPERLFEGTSPAWSPDGTRMAVVIDGDIFVYRISDGERTQITMEGGLDPAWSPDGEKIAFSWSRDENFDIYIVDLP